MKKYKYFVSYGIIKSNPVGIISLENGVIELTRKIEEYEDIKAIEKILKEKLIEGESKEKLEEVIEVRVINWILIDFKE